MSWFKEDEDALVERYTASLNALASQHGVDERFRHDSAFQSFIRSVAKTDALRTLHQRAAYRRQDAP